MSFTQFNLHPQINAGIEALGYKTPTPIQMQSIPAILQGRDVMGLAQTGTGKTAAFALPILQRLMNGPGKMVRALIVAPTRELAEQINESINEMSRSTTLKSVALYGGVSKNPQIEKLRQGAEIIVACPGRLLDLVAQGVADLSGIEVFVLDEADRMFDMGFLPDIRKITKQLPENRQTQLFSATMPPDIRSLAKDILHDPLTIRIGNDIPVSTVSHTLYPVEQHLKTALLIKLLKETDTESVLVFARTKHRTTRVAMQMKKAGSP
jgi:ATP-dependent RNA helicase RhlE